LLGGQEAPDIASLNAHFDHYRALPADQNRAGTLTDLFTIDDIGAAGSADLSRVLLFSMGCHAGLSVSDVAVGGPRIDDWAQTLLGAGATFAGNTGFGYGDDTIVGATEELMRRFAAGLDGSLTVGGAMAAAKQQYLASTATITPFDEKVASQVVVYGMPQLRVGGDAPVAPPSGPQALPDYAGTGLDAAPLVIDAGTGPSGPVQPVRTPRGNYYAFDGMTQSTADQPVQPKTLIDVTQDDGRRVRGALLTALESSDVDLPDPVYFTPAIDLGATAPEVSTTTSLFPSRLQRIARYESPTGPRDQAIVVTGQFRGDPSDSTGGGTQRLFTQIGAVAFVAPTDGPGAGDESPPTIDDVEAVLDGDGLLRVRVRATDDTGIALVTILHTDAADPGSWTEATLPAAGGGIHSAALAVPAGVETIDYFVQVVDVGGNVAVSSNKGAFFRSVVSGPPTIEIDGPFDTVTGWYQGPVEVSVTPFVPNGDVSVTVNGSPSDSTFTLDAEGAYEIVAVSPGGEVTRRQARLDATAPVLTVSSSPATRPSASPVTVSFSAGDNGSGVASLRYSTDGAFESGPVTIVGATGSIVVGSAGITTIEAVAVDRLGHESPPTRLIVEVTETADVVAPTVVCGAVPTDWQDSNVRITCTSDDTDLADAEQASFDLATTVPRGVETSTAFTGATSVCDTATNCTRAGPLGPLRIDRRPPDIVVAYPLEGEVIVLGDDVTADVSCSDSGSGVATCSSTALDTSTVGARALTATAIDSVGNVRTMTIHYEVRFAFGGFIDPVTEPPNLNTGKAGRTYPIKFTLNDASGAPVRDIASVVSVTYRSRGCNGGPVSDDEAAAASNSRGLRLTTDGYSYNWRTPRTPGCYQVTVLLADDTRHVAEFRLR
jgi:hypothetical protein